jgi:hypothetical protein
MNKPPHPPVKRSRTQLRLESLERRQLLAGVVGGGTEVGSNIVHPNGNIYDQVLMTGSSVTVTADAGQVTRVSFLDLSGDIVQVEFSGAGSLNITLDDGSYKGPAEPTKYNQPSVRYVTGHATLSVAGSDASSNVSAFSVGTGNAHRGSDNPIFAGGKMGGNNLADLQRLIIVADPAKPNGSDFAGIRMGNTMFSGSSGVVGISASNVAVQTSVTIGDIDASGSAVAHLCFGALSKFEQITLAGGDLVQSNGSALVNCGGYKYDIGPAAGTLSNGRLLPALQRLVNSDGTDTLLITGNGIADNANLTAIEKLVLNGATLAIDRASLVQSVQAGLTSITGQAATSKLVIQAAAGDTVDLTGLSIATLNNLTVDAVGGAGNITVKLSAEQITGVTGFTAATGDTLTINTSVAGFKALGTKAGSATVTLTDTLANLIAGGDSIKGLTASLGELTVAQANEALAGTSAFGYTIKDTAANLVLGSKAVFDRATRITASSTATAAQAAALIGSGYAMTFDTADTLPNLEAGLHGSALADARASGTVIARDSTARLQAAFTAPVSAYAQDGVEVLDTVGDDFVLNAAQFGYFIVGTVVLSADEAAAVAGDASADLGTLSRFGGNGTLSLGRAGHPDAYTVNLGSSGVRTVRLLGSGDHDVTASAAVAETFIVGADYNGGATIRGLSVGDVIDLDGADDNAAFNTQVAGASDVTGTGKWHFANGILTYWDDTLSRAITISLVGVTTISSDNGDTFAIGG